MSLPNKIKNVDTSALLAYLHVVDNLHQSGSQMLNSLVLDVQEKRLKPDNPEYLKIFRECTNARDSFLEVSEAIQSEIDVRMKKDLGIEKGIRKVQVLLTRYEQLLKSSQEAEQRNWEQNLKIAKEETDADTQES